MLEPFFTTYVLPFLTLLIQSLIVVVPLLISVAYLTYAERKVIAAMQLRKGPNVVGPFGLLQPFADAIKMLHKETIIPTASDKTVFMLAPLVTFTLSISAWAVIPWSENFILSDINVGISYLFALSSLGVYGIIMAGWASNSKYALLGGLRSAAQMVSYEVSIGLIIVCVLLCAGSLNLKEIVLAQRNMWFVIPHFPMAVIFFVSALAETNRAPFDLPEAEAELVSGYNVEYSSISFGLFFLGEYANMILMSALGSILFLGGWLPPGDWPASKVIPGFVWMALKISFFLFLFLWVRATLPRYRYDQLMRLGWKIFLPVSLGWVVLTATVVFMMDL
ncbi:MAG: NADH-quinone oxidoreductase subunit NuoH [Alphaproteobacteria bacterium]